MWPRLIEFHRIIKNNKLLALLAGNNRRKVKIKIIAVKIKHDIIQSKAVGPYAAPNENACMLSLAEINC